MSIVMPNLPVGKSKKFVTAKHDSGVQTQDWLAQVLASTQALAWLMRGTTNTFTRQAMCPDSTR